MNVPSTSPLKGASRASLVYAGKRKVRYFLNTVVDVNFPKQNRFSYTDSVSYRQRIKSGPAHNTSQNHVQRERFTVSYISYTKHDSGSAAYELFLKIKRNLLLS
jgi:hypothetical protein